MRARRMSLPTEQAYLHWMRRLIAFFRHRHPRDLGAREIEAFLTHLAVDRHVTSSTQNQALNALLFLYRSVLEIKLPWLNQLVRAPRSRHVPVVLSREEAQRILAQLDGTRWLMARLLYGSGLRVLECLRLRVKDVDLERNEIVVRDGKGEKDRVTVLPDALQQPLRGHLARLRRWLDAERQRNAPGVSLPFALGRKYPGAAQSWPYRERYVVPRAATPSGTPLPPTCSNPVTTFAPCRSYSVTAT